MALEEGYCVLCWRRKRRGEGTSVRSRRGYSFDLKQWRRDHWLNFVLSIVDCIWTQTKRGSYSPTIYILHFSPSFSCFLRLTTDVTMGIRANLQRRSFLATFLSLFLDFFPQNLVLLQNLRVECSVAVYLSKALCTRPFLTTSLSSMLLFLYPILPWELVCNWTYDVVNSGVLTHLPSLCFQVTFYSPFTITWRNVKGRRMRKHGRTVGGNIFWWAEHLDTDYTGNWLECIDLGIWKVKIPEYYMEKQN